MKEEMNFFLKQITIFLFTLFFGIYYYRGDISPSLFFITISLTMATICLGIGSLKEIKLKKKMYNISKDFIYGSIMMIISLIITSIISAFFGEKISLYHVFSNSHLLENSGNLFIGWIYALIIIFIYLFADYFIKGIYGLLFILNSKEF